MNKWFTTAFFVLAVLLFVSAGVAEKAVAEQDIIPPNEMVSGLERVTSDITDELNHIREQNRISAEALAKTDLSGETAGTILNAKLDNVTYGHSSLIISPDNVVLQAAPAQYRDLVGLNLSYQPETRYANEKQSPVVSDIFYLEEGFYGISISYPVFSNENEYLGYTDVTIYPDEFFRGIITPFTELTGYEVFIIQKDGLTIYETNEVETGKNILTDPLYDTPEMRNVSQAVIDNPDGTITYTFWNRFWNKEVLRQALWTTFYPDNQEWRVGIVRDVDGDADMAPITEWAEPEDLNASIEEMTTFVQGAAAFARTVGQEEACKAFNDLSGPYITDSLYIFGYDMDGTALALPYQQGLLGKNRMDLTDVNGLSIMPALIDAEKRGGDYLYFVYPNPMNGFVNQLKLFRVEPVDEDWFIASGLFLPSIAAEVDPDEISALIDRVKNALRHAEEVGKKQAIMDFNDLDQPFADGGAYIFAYEYDGTTLALPYQPEVIGENRMEFTDIYGSSIIKQEINTAKRGGGFVYVIYYNPDTGNNELKLCYVLPAGEDWLVGSGIYTGTGLEMISDR